MPNPFLTFALGVLVGAAIVTVAFVCAFSERRRDPYWFDAEELL